MFRLSITSNKSEQLVVSLSGTTPVEVVRHLCYVPLAVFERDTMRIYIPKTYKLELMAVIKDLQYIYEFEQNKY